MQLEMPATKSKSPESQMQSIELVQFHSATQNKLL